jgi:hypothetical protein
MPPIASLFPSRPALRLRRIPLHHQAGRRTLAEDAPDRLLDTAMAVCGHDVDDLFTRGLDLIARGCGTA